jgi:hypothetical protein
MNGRMKQAAINKITEAMQDCAEKRVPAEPIAEFLKSKCGEDGEFAALIAQEHKTLDKCFAFVYEQAQKHLNHANGWINDEEVYMMAVDYFSLDDAEMERQKAEEAKRREQERQEREKERQQQTAAAKEEKALEIKRKAKAKHSNEDQISLF